MHEPFGRYILLERVAIGGMAEIFRAKAPGLGGFEKMLAIKRLHPRYSQDAEFIEMLIDEARITVELSHSNIGQIFDLGKVDDHYFIAMEFIDGRDLYKVMKTLRERGQVFPIEAAASVIMDVCAGLDYAHRKKDRTGRPLHIVHRDVSPQNVIVSMDGDVKLVDFGIAKAALRVGQTESGVIKGKFYYMSPEQAKGETLDHRTDIFSLGIVLYELLTGELLYKDDDDITLLSKVRRAEIIPPSQVRPEIPTRLEQIVMKALSRDRTARYPSAQHMQRDLSRYLRDVGTTFDKGRLSQLMKDLYLAEDALGGPLHNRASFAVDRQSMISLAAQFDEDEDPTHSLVETDAHSTLGEVSDLLELDSHDIELIDESADFEPTVDLGGTPLEGVDSILASGPGDPRFAAALGGADPTPFRMADTPAPSAAIRRPVLAAPQAVARVPLVSHDDDDGFTEQPTVIVPQEQVKAPAQRSRRVPSQAPTTTDTPIHTTRRRRGGRQKLLLVGLLISVVIIAGAVTTLLLKTPPTKPTVVSSTVVALGGAPRRAPIKAPAIAAVPTAVTHGAPSPASAPARPTTPAPKANSAVNQQLATLDIRSRPAGANVQINGRWIANETTPTRVSAVPGQKTRIKLQLDGYMAYETEVTARPGERVELAPNLRRRAGALNVESVPGGAAVSVDGQSRGRTPLTVTGLQLGRPLLVELSKDGFRPVRKQFNFGPDQLEGLLKVSLDPIGVDLPPTNAAPKRAKRRSVVKRRARPRPRRRAREVEPEPDPDYAAAAGARRFHPSGERRLASRGGSRRAPVARTPVARRAPVSGGFGSLSVSSRQWGAVFVDRRRVAVETPLIKLSVATGRHQVHVCFGGDPGRCTAPKTIEIVRGKSSVVRF